MWTIHIIFVKHKERSFEAVALFSGRQRMVYKKDKDSLFNFLSKPKVWEKEKIRRFMEENPNMMNKYLILLLMRKKIQLVLI